MLSTCNYDGNFGCSTAELFISCGAFCALFERAARKHALHVGGYHVTIQRWRTPEHFELHVHQTARRKLAYSWWTQTVQNGSTHSTPDQLYRAHNFFYLILVNLSSYAQCIRFFVLFIFYVYFFIHCIQMVVGGSADVRVA